MKPKYKIHFGYTPKGKDKWAKYATLRAALEARSEVFNKTGVVLAIVAA